MSENDRFIVYGGTENHGFDARVLELVNETTGMSLPFSHIWHEKHPDGEPGFILEDFERIRDRHAIIFSCPISYELESELRDILCATKLQYGAASATVVLSYLRYRRQDRAEKNHEITRLRWFVHSLTAWGADRLVVCEPHSVENTLKHCDEANLDLHICDPTRIIAEDLMSLVRTLDPDQVVVYSPDYGSVGRAVAFAKATGTRVVATPKQRIYDDTVKIGGEFDTEAFLTRIHKDHGDEVPVSCNTEELRGQHVFMREDELATGTTALLTARKLREAGARSVRFIATHPVCTRGWKMKFFPQNGGNPFDRVWLGNTRARGEEQTNYQGSTGGRVSTIDIAPAVAETLSGVIRDLDV